MRLDQATDINQWLVPVTYSFLVMLRRFNKNLSLKILVHVTREIIISWLHVKIPLFQWIRNHCVSEMNKIV